MVEVINQSAACIFLQVDLEGFGGNRRSRDEEVFFACFLGMNEFDDPVA